MKNRFLKEEKRLDNPKVIMQTFDVNSHYIENEIVLPKISDVELLERYKCIRPIVYNWEEYLFYYLRDFNQQELRNLSFLADINKSLGERVKYDDSVKVDILDEFSCYHTYGAPMFFKPSIAEVLSQFPDNLLSEANAFYLYEYPKNVADLERQFDILAAGCHKSRVKALKIYK